MEIELSDEAKADLLFWKQAGDHKMMNRITSLILSIQQTPHTGIGKPEPLRYKLKGCGVEE